jgi:hypothetical protein
VIAFCGRSLVNLIALVLIVSVDGTEAEDYATHSRFMRTCNKRDGSSIVHSIPLNVSSTRKVSSIPD